jgi:hypothetical protein
VVFTSPIGRGLGEGSERQGGVRETISIIDKKEKVKKDKLTEMFKEIELTNTQIEAIFEFIKF